MNPIILISILFVVAELFFRDRVFLIGGVIVGVVGIGMMIV